jgi:hypothetical protein
VADFPGAYFLLDSRLSPSSPFVFARFLTLLSPMFLSAGNRSWRAELGQGTTTSPS